MNLIKNIPIPIAGLILALVSMGNLLNDIHPYLKYLFGTIGLIFLVLLLLKVILYPKIIKNDLKNPIILSSSGTFSMSLMVLSTYINSFSGDLALSIWILGVALHILLIIYFTYHYIIRNFNINTVYPSWWIVFIGITMGAITAHVHGLDEIGFLFFLFGFLSMLITLPLVIYRYLRYPNEEDSNKPLICIFTAVMSILIVGYTNSVNAVSNEFLILLYAFAFAFFLFASYMVYEYRNLDFYPSFSAFTFPFVITAIASTEVFKIFGSGIFNYIILIQTIIAVILVICVVFRYLKYLIS